MRWILIGVLSVLALGGCREEDLAAKRAVLAEERAALEGRVAAIADDELREVADSLVHNLMWMQEMALDHRTPPARVVYADSPFRVLDDYATPQALAENFAGGIVALNDPVYGRDDVDILLPFEYPFDAELRWDLVVLADGTVIPVSPDFRAPPPNVRVANRGTRLDVMPSDVGFTAATPLPAMAEGTLELTLPEEIVRMRLTARDTGRAQEIGDHIVTLRAIDGHAVVIDIARRDDGIIVGEPIEMIVAARDATSRFLELSGRSSGPSEGFREETKAVTLELLDMIEVGAIKAEEIDAEMERRGNALLPRYGRTYVHETYFRGEVDVVEIAFARTPATMVMPLKLTVHQEVSSDYSAPFVLADIPVESVAYDHDLNYLVADDLTMEVAPEDLPRLMAVEAHLTYDARGAVRFTFTGEVVSNVLLKTSDRFDLRDAPVRFLNANGERVPGRPSSEYRVNRLEYVPGDLPEGTTRVQGRIGVVLMPDVRADVYPAHLLPEGFEISDNRVIFSRRDGMRVLGMSADGRILRMFHSERFLNPGGPTRAVDYYYGNPVQLLVVTAGPTVTVPFDYDIPLPVPE